MLKGIRKILKTMGEALAFANAGEMLTEEQKSEVLAQYKEPNSISTDTAANRVVLASDEEFSPEIVDRAITLCHKKNAMLDLLCVSQVGSRAAIPLTTVLPNLASETDLDFQVTRRHGDLLVVTNAYISARRDILLILISVSDRLRSVQHKRAEWLQHTTEWKIKGVDIQYMYATTNA